MPTEIIKRSIEEEMRESYLNYAMSVIVSRALPDVRDGLKPIHRRILYAMNNLGLTSDKPFKKSATIVGEVLGKYHPHGDAAVYDTMVRLAQPFSMRYLLVNGQGNFGSIDGDNAAAMRYTEAKMTKIAQEMLDDIKKETVDFRPNFDDSLKEPEVLPAAFPNLLANGSTGIAVGMATNIPPHNINELCDAIKSFIKNPDISLSKLIKKVPGPDFPTGGIIHGLEGIKTAYKTGKGKITVRGKIDIEEQKKRGKKEAIIINEIPYQVNKTNMIMKIADLVRDKKIDGISDLRDESDRNGMRIVIELKRNANTKIILNQLFKHTQLQSSFGINMLALDHGIPKVMGLKEIFAHYVAHRKEVIIRRTKFDLDKAEKRAHILEGLLTALAHIDEVIKIIRGSKTVDEARENLMGKFKFSQAQAQAILDMRLQKLVNLERVKVQTEFDELQELIKDLKDILGSDQRVLDIIAADLDDISEKYGDERRTEIVGSELENMEIEDLISQEDMVITITNKGLIKRTPITSYKKQKRGGMGVSGATNKNDEFIEHLFVASTHSNIVFVSNKGKAYFIKVHEIPEGAKSTRGRSIKMLLNLATGEELKAFVPIEDFEEERFLILATSKGIVKKSKINEFANAKARGVYAISLDRGDDVVSVRLTDGKKDLLLCSRKGNALYFDEKKVRCMGRAARGVRGIKLKSGDELAGMVIVEKGEKLLVISEKGFGKRVKFNLFSPHNRGTSGQIYVKTSEATGEIAAVRGIAEADELFAITLKGMIIRMQAKDIPVQGRTARGVRAISLRDPDMVVDIGRIAADDDEDA